MTNVLFAEGVCVLLLTVLILLAKDKTPTHYYMASIGFTLAYVLMCSWGARTGLLERFPALAGTDVAAIYPMAACSYAGFYSMVHEGEQPPRRALAYLAAAVVAAIAASAVFAHGALTTPSLAREPGAIPGHFATPARRLMTLFADVSILAAFASLLAMALSAYSSGRVRNRKWFRHRIASLVCYLAGVLVTAASDAFSSEEIRLVGYALSGMNSVVFSFALISLSYARYGIPNAQARPVAPALEGDAEELSLRLSSLMSRETPYKDPDLSIKTLAEMLKEDPVRLSSHLNQTLLVSFPSYINDWRLKAVCRDLVSRSDRTILDIALDNGFNSKSNFNALFVKAYGKTPRQFRKDASAPTREGARGFGPTSGSRRTLGF